MANITVIDHGMANWETSLNRMLGELGASVADTGLINLPLKNVTTMESNVGSYLTVRNVGPFFAITAQFSCAAAGEIAIGDIPANMIGNQTWQYFVGFHIQTQAIQLKIDSNYQLKAVIPTSAIGHMIDLNTVIAINK